mgnify:CR=1 FL=1
MKYFYVEVDTNDADYIGNIVEIEDESVEKFKPLIEKIKNFEPYTGFSRSGYKFTHGCNFPYGECLREDLGEKSPCELYDIDEETCEQFIEIFNLYGGEWGFHTITRIQEITLGEKLL